MAGFDHLGGVQAEILPVPRADDLHPERNPRRVPDGHRHRGETQQVYRDERPLGACRFLGPLGGGGVEPTSNGGSVDTGPTTSG